LGYDKYGINWKVWGQNPAKPEKKENPLLQKMDYSYSKEHLEKDEPDKNPDIKSNNSCKLKNARFLVC
jgi:hypothetical protein